MTSNSPKPHTDPTDKHLSADEAAVLDGVLAKLSAYDRVPPDPASTLDIDPASDKGRCATGWMRVIAQCPCDTPPVDLAQRTMAKINEARLREKFTKPATRHGASRWTWTEFGAVAAMLVIGLVLLFPVIHRTPNDNARVATSSNDMSVTANAMGSYGGNLTSIFKSPWNTPPTLSDSFNTIDFSDTNPVPGIIRVKPLDPSQPNGLRLLTVTLPDPATTPGLTFGFSGALQGNGQTLHVQRPDGMRFRIPLPPDVQVQWNDPTPGNAGQGMWIIQGTIPAQR